MIPLYLLIISCFLALSVSFYLILRSFKKKEEAYKTALEFNQKKLDLQTSRINILVRALPSLQTLLFDHKSSDSWKLMCLEESRALVNADEVAYWRYIEGDQRLILECSRGIETQHKGAIVDVESGNNEFVEVTKKRMPLLKTHTVKDRGEVYRLQVPLVVDGNLNGVFEFQRNGSVPLVQKDLDVVTLFIRQVGIALENRNIVNNREKFYLELVQALADSLDSRDQSGEGQNREARALARGIGHVLELPEEFIYYLELAALTHDIGNIAIDEQLLKKPGKLTAEEFDIIKKHPENGYKILAPVSLLAPVAPMVLYHQEWFNGKGYPEGLTGEEIPLGARIVAILDAWCSMRSHRPWRKALSQEIAIGEIKKGSGTQFDPKIVDAFLKTIERQGIKT